MCMIYSNWLCSFLRSKHGSIQSGSKDFWCICYCIIWQSMWLMDMKAKLQLQLALFCASSTIRVHRICSIMPLKIGNSAWRFDRWRKVSSYSSVIWADVQANQPDNVNMNSSHDGTLSANVTDVNHKHEPLTATKCDKILATNSFIAITKVISPISWMSHCWKRNASNFCRNMDTYRFQMNWNSFRVFIQHWFRFSMRTMTIIWWMPISTFLWLYIDWIEPYSYKISLIESFHKPFRQMSDFNFNFNQKQIWLHSIIMIQEIIYWPKNSNSLKHPNKHIQNM